MSTRPPLRFPSAAALTLGLLAAACAESPTTTDPSTPLGFAKGGGGPPSSCSAFAPLAITLGDAGGDGLTSDGGGAYLEGVDGVEAHINDPTGNLSIWTTASARALKAHTASGTVDIDRAYTNGHSTTCGLRLSSLPASSSAVFEGEVRQGGTGSTIAKVRYGLTCTGSAQASSRVAISYAEGLVTITAPAGNHCTQGAKKNTWVSSAVAGFTMTLDP